MMEVPAVLVERLRAAGNVVVLTGAGVSAESGIPTFREAQTGLWSTFDPEELATPEGFRRNPGLVWDWYAERRRQIERVSPNPGHCALAQLEARSPSFTLITQNIDGLHRAAGSSNIIELHGNIRRNRCFAEDRVLEEIVAESESPPRCPDCGGPVRPDVVWFHELLPAAAVEAAYQAARKAEIFFSIGTSGIVHPAASLPIIARRAGAYLVEINPYPTELSLHANVIVREKSGEFLPALMEAVRKN